jgi:hypothetical protein
MIVVTTLDDNERRVIRTALLGWASCPIVDRDRAVALLMKIERLEETQR